MPELTDAQKHAIIASWTIPAMNPIDAGEIIFYKFFQKYPDNHQKFKKFKDMPLTQLKGFPAFRAHASRVVNTFSATVDCLHLKGGWEAIPGIWKEVAEGHRERKISKTSFIVRIVILIMLPHVFY